MAVEVLLRELIKVETPVLFLGDLNAVPESEPLQGIYQRMDEAFGDENPATFPSFHPMRKIDYIFASTPVQFDKATVVEEVISDHLPLVAEVEFDVGI